MKFILWFGAISLIGCSILRAGDQVTVLNGDFEQGKTNWNLSVPPESMNAGCHFSVEITSAHSGKQAARLTAARMARFGINYDQPTPFAVQVGHRYRLTAWVKAGNNFTVEAGTPGPVLRATLFDEHMKNVSGGHLFVGLGGTQRGEATLLPSQAVPPEWTKIEGVVEIPAGTVSMILFLFCWKASGTLWVDDISAVDIGAGG